jgi:hypothetical protein
MAALLSAGPTDVLRTTATTRQAFIDGLTTGLAINAGIALVGAFIALCTFSSPTDAGPTSSKCERSQHHRLRSAGNAVRRRPLPVNPFQEARS